MKRKLKLSTLHVESFVTSTNKVENTNAILGGFPLPTDTDNPDVCINYTHIMGQCDIFFTKYPICKPTIYIMDMACALYTVGTECFNTRNVCATKLGDVC